MGAVFAERFYRTLRYHLKRPVFEKGDGNWGAILPNRTKQYKNTMHSSTNLTPIQASLKKNDGYVYHSLLEKRKKIKHKFQLNDLVRVANLMKTFSKEDTINWSYKLYKTTEIKNDTLPSYKIDKLPERYNEVFI